jgi:predicted nucleic acid-binding protein
MLTPKRRAYIDTNVWITAVKSDEAAASRALTELEAPDLQTVISDYVRLEALPKPTFQQRYIEVESLKELFALAEKISLDQRTIVAHALGLAARYDLTPIDALHVAAALAGNVDEFITLEKPGKPFFRVRELAMRSIYQAS